MEDSPRNQQFYHITILSLVPHLVSHEDEPFCTDPLGMAILL